MKKCITCKVIKDESEFFFRNKDKGILYGNCKECKRKREKTYYTTDRRESLAKGKKRRRVETLNFINRYKSFIGCKCGDRRYYVLDMHHLRDKLDTINNLVKQGASMDRIKKEIRKCEVMCSNCHRAYHHKQKRQSHKEADGEAVSLQN